MIDPAEIVDSLVALLQDIPELVQEMDGDLSRIFAYHDLYPQRVSLELAKYQMPAPGIMVAWQGTAPGSFGNNEVWKHQFSLFLRSREAAPDDPPTSYYRLFRLLTKGVPSSAGQPLSNLTVHPACDPMDVPSITRQTDAEGVDYFEVAMSFTEMGDD